MTDPTARTGKLATEAFDLLIDAVAQIPPQSWDQTSNLDGWSLRDLVGHATGSAAKIVTLIEDGEIWGGPSQPADWVCEDPAARLRSRGNRRGAPARRDYSTAIRRTPVVSRRSA